MINIVFTGSWIVESIKRLLEIYVSFRSKDLVKIAMFL
jgi:hypothetical protein